MYIVIAGAGLVGGSLAQSLAENRHDVVIVERDRTVCNEIASRVGVLAICGVATDIEILEQAGITKADVAVGALPSDADNLAFSLLASHFKVPRIMARMRDPRYEDAYEKAGVNRVINVGDLFVRQLVLEIEQPSLRQVATFGRGKASIVVAVIPEGAAVDGKTVMEIGKDKGFPEECVIAGIFREEAEKFIFPRGAIDLRSGDRVFLAADSANIRKAAAFLQRKK